METISIAKAEESKSMADSVKMLFESMHKVVSLHCKLNKMAMCAAQSLGYNGFKRWHRHNARQFFDYDIKLANEIFNRFRIKAGFKDYDVSYSPSGIDEHLKSWEKALLEGIQELGELGKSYYELTGMECCAASSALKDMAHDHEKVCRYIKRFMESDWLAIDMHIVDDRLHEKYKQNEEWGGVLWNSLMNSTSKK